MESQVALFDDRAMLPSAAPTIASLKPAANLLAVFEDCHNYIYANRGLLKERIFHEIVKILLLKLTDEQRDPAERALLCVTADCLGEDGEERILARIQKLTSLGRARFPTLFPDGFEVDLPASILRFVIARLQGLSLTATPADVKGAAFQTFISRHQRGDRGEYFTPDPAVHLAVALAKPVPGEAIIDPACGSGGFLLKTVEMLRSAHASRNPLADATVRGVEFNPDVARAAELRLLFEGGSGREILCANALQPHGLENSFDVVLTNPPFGSKGKIDDADLLRNFDLGGRWEQVGESEWRRIPGTCRAQAPEVLFIEQSLRMLRPGGRMAIVLPDGILQNSSMAFARAWIRTQAHVLGVISLPQETFVPYGTGIKTSVLLLRRMPARKPKQCFMACVKRVGYSSNGQPVFARSAAGHIIHDSNGQPTLASDVNDVVDAYVKAGSGAPPRDVPSFWVAPESVQDRLDPEFYLPEDMSLISALQERKAVPLSSVAAILAESSSFRLQPDATIRYIAISDIDHRTCQVVNQQVIRAHDAPSRASYRVSEGDILFAVSGASTGTDKQACAVIGPEESDAIVSNGFAVIRANDGLDPHVLAWLLRTPTVLRQIRRLRTGHAIPAVATGDLENVLIPMPSRKLQDEVAAAARKMLELRQTSVQLADRISQSLDPRP